MMCDPVKLVWQLWTDEASPVLLKAKAITMFTLVMGINVIVWALLLIFTASYPYFFTSGLLAWGLGLRHAMDADHIAAIDNYTRKLLEDGREPFTVGFWFALGHSTIVIILGVVSAFGSTGVSDSITDLQYYGGIVGTSVSTAFLWTMGLINLFTLMGLLRTWSLRREGKQNAITARDILRKRSGLFHSLFSASMHVMNRGWKMYPVGILFGLGFDTASEVALMALAVLSAHNGFPAALVILLPVLFAAAMCLLDTVNSMLMMGVYRWTTRHQDKRLNYNIIFTFVGVVISFGVGMMELFQLLGNVYYDTEGWWWDLINSVDFEILGPLILGAFMLLFVVCYFHFLWQWTTLEEADESTAMDDLETKATIDCPKDQIPDVEEL